MTLEFKNPWDLLAEFNSDPITILAQCDDEWRSLVLFGFYTGQRLSDLAVLTWQNLDLNQKELRLVSRKTGRQIVSACCCSAETH